MTLEEINFIGLAIAIFLVLLALFAVWRQLRQSNRLARAQMNTDALDAGSDLIFDLARQSELAAISLKTMSADEPLTPLEARRWQAYLDGVLMLLESQLLAAQDGLTKTEALERMEALSLWLFSKPAGRSHWENRKHRFSEKLRVHMERLLAQAASDDAGSRTVPDIP